MLTWNAASVIPTEPETAVIAILPHSAAPEDADPFLLGEVFRFDLRYQRWVGETSGLLLKHKAFWWLREGDVLVGLRG